jgi:hypothetical protein
MSPSGTQCGTARRSSSQASWQNQGPFRGDFAGSTAERVGVAEPASAAFGVVTDSVFELIDFNEGRSSGPVHSASNDGVGARRDGGDNRGIAAARRQGERSDGRRGLTDGRCGSRISVPIVVRLKDGAVRAGELQAWIGEGPGDSELLQCRTTDADQIPPPGRR